MGVGGEEGSEAVLSGAGNQSLYRKVTFMSELGSGKNVIVES